MTYSSCNEVATVNMQLNKQWNCDRSQHS